MSLPDCSKRNRLFGYEKRNYDSEMLRSLMELKNHDNVTTDNCVAIVRRINEYLELSKYLVIKFWVCSDIFRAIGSEYTNDPRANGMFAAYCTHESANAKRSRRNCIKIARSVASQRRMIGLVKRVIKLNRVNRDWEALLNSKIDELFDRITRLTEQVLPGNIDGTPLELFVKYIGKRGETFDENIEKFIQNSGTIFDDLENNDQIVRYRSYIEKTIIDHVDDTDMASLMESASARHAKENARLERIEAERRAEEKEARDKAEEKATELLYHLCSCAEAAMAKERSATLVNSIKVSHLPELFVVAGARLSGSKLKNIGYLCGRPGRISVSASIKYAKMFRSEQDANAYASAARSDGLLAETAKIDLRKYI